MSQNVPEEVSRITKCTVISCSNYQDTQSPDSSTIKFFPFPKASALEAVWKEKCGVSAYHPVTSARVCAAHFRKTDITAKNRLKKDAVPWENLGWMLGMPEVKLSVTIEPPPPGVFNIKPVIDLHADLTLELDHLTRVQSSLVKKLALQRKKNYNVESEIRRLSLLMAKSGYVKMSGKFKWDLIEEVFSPAQIGILFGHKKVVWSHDDMARAFILRHLGSKECYLYIKNVLNMPLPALGAVQKWAASKCKVT